MGCCGSKSQFNGIDRYVKIFNYNNTLKNGFYDIITDKVVFTITKYNSVSYFQADLFYAKESFNGLNKFAFLDNKGEIVVPFQSLDHIFHIEPFQTAYNLAKQKPVKFVSLVMGHDNGYFKYALMDTNGKIYSQLRN